MRFTVPALVVLVLAALLPIQAQPVEVITHPSNEIASLSRSELSKIFLKRLDTWADRTPAVPVDQVPHSAVRDEFTRWVHRRRVVNVEVYWKRLIFSGRAVPPPEVADDAAVIEFVRKTPGAVGYVRSSAGVAGVRRLEVTE